MTVSDRTLRVVTLVVALLIAAIVALSPGRVYAPTPRVILYLLVSTVPAILFAAEASARFQMKLPGFIATAGGGAAIMFTAVLLLTSLSSPAERIAVYHLFNANGEPVYGLDRRGAVRLPITEAGLRVTHFVDENTIVVIFPEQVSEADIQIRPVTAGGVCSGVIRYAGTRQRRMVLERDLSCRQR